MRCSASRLSRSIFVCTAPGCRYTWLVFCVHHTMSCLQVLCRPVLSFGVPRCMYGDEVLRQAWLVCVTPHRVYTEAAISPELNVPACMLTRLHVHPAWLHAFYEHLVHVPRLASTNAFRPDAYEATRLLPLLRPVPLKLTIFSCCIDAGPGFM
jgi:hypothetical protein